MGRIGFEEKFCFLEKHKDGNLVFECRDEIGKLWGVEKMLKIVSKSCGDIHSSDFFEFGSAEFNVFNRIPMSGKVSHFMMFGTDLNYNCFDAGIGEDDFDLVCNIVKLHKKIMSGSFSVKDEKMFRVYLDDYAKICREKDLPVPFVYEVLAEEIPSLGIYYHLNLDNLKSKIRGSSCNCYSEIVEKINCAGNPVIFSFNVLNAPSLTDAFPFWKIEKGFHVHGVNEVELLGKMGISNYFFDKTDRRGIEELGISRSEFVCRFKEMFGVVGEVGYEDGFFFWNF